MEMFIFHLGKILAYSMTDLNNLISVELRPDRHLIDPNFDSYKLSLASLPSFAAPVVDGVFQVLVDEKDLGYEKIRCLTLHNYLVLDPWNKEDVYYIDSNGCIRKYHVSLETHIQPATMVFSFGSEMSNQEKQLPPSLYFPSATLCVACDGFGGTFLIDTQLRNETTSNSWKILRYDEDKSPSLVLNAVYRGLSDDGDSSTEYVDYVLLKFHEQSQNKESITKIALEWSTLVKATDAEDYQLSEAKTFYGKSVPMYVSLSPDCTEFHIAASSSFQYQPSWDVEVNEISDLQDEVEQNGIAKEAHPYRWKQTGETILIYTDLPSGATSKSVVYSLNSKQITVGFRQPKDSNPSLFLSGDLYLDVDPEGSTWTVSDGQLEIVLLKRLEGRQWVTVVEGDDRGKYIVDPEEAKRIHHQLAHLTSDSLNADNPEEKVFNSGQLEECDAYYDSSATLMRFDVTSSKFSHVADISSLRWLFNYNVECVNFPAIVFRHDVDAVAWQPLSTNTTGKKDSRVLYKHIATFNALGYVHASKNNLKYCSSPPDASYAAFCECQRRIYVYRQPTPLSSSIRNRTSGTLVRKISIQQVATIDGNDDILGFATAAERMYVLTAGNLIVFKVSSDVGL